MKIVRNSFLCLSLLLVIRLTAVAGGKDGISTSKDGRQTIAASPISPFHPLESAPLSGLMRLYDNSSKYPLGVYWCCNGYTISGSASGVGATFADAMPFTPSANATVEEIGLAIGFISGTNEITVSLNADNGGVPGTSLGSFNVSNLPTFGECCSVELQSVGSGIPVTAGTQYWVVVQTTSPNSDTYAAWNDNVTNQTLQPFAFWENGTWEATEGVLGAFAVVGTIP